VAARGSGEFKHEMSKAVEGIDKKAPVGKVENVRPSIVAVVL